MGLVLVASFFVVPVGVVFGSTARIVLAVRRRAARRVAPDDVTGRSRQASAGVTGQQTGDLVLSVLLLAGCLYLGTLTAVEAGLDGQGFVSENTTALGRLGLAAASVGGLLLLGALAVIPVAAVLIVCQIRDTEVLAGEAYALGRRAAGYRRIRLTHGLSWLASGAMIAAGSAWTAVTLPSLF